MNNDIAIKVENLTKVYHLYDKPQDRLKEALNPFKKSYHHDFYAMEKVSFEIKKGETVGILGRNGAGKSTLLKMITGVLTPTSGSIEVNGKIASLLELGAGFNPEMTGIENIYLNGTLMGFTKEEMDKKIDNIIAFADIGEFIYQPAKMYSSGMYARLAFAVSINVEPDILIVDEALSVGDEKFQRKCYAKIENLAQDGCTILFVTHSTSLLESICTSGLLFVNGKLTAYGESKHVVETYRELLYGTNKTANSIQDNVSQITQVNKQSKEKYLTHIDISQEEGIKIHAVWIKDEHNNYDRTEFKPHEVIYLGLRISAYEDVEELMTGLRIKTLEGIEVFGGSSNYIQKNIKNITRGQTFDIEIKITLSLCNGAYFVTFAVADKENLEGMVYQDKQIDILDFKIVEHPIQSSGIASLHYTITSSEI
jgi:ABC-type polysaccharide/polyol phosphate transport system ATPase subunit